jgi:hypothetical protein
MGARYHHAMQIALGTVVDGKVVVEGHTLTEGATVAVLSEGPADATGLTLAQEEELLDAIQEIDRGQFTSLEALLESLPKSA